MKKRIFYAILAVASAVLLLCLAVVMGVLYNRFSAAQLSRLKSELLIAAHGVEQGGDAWLYDLDTDGYRLTLVASDGTALFDSEADASMMENHAGREEIQAALTTGSGQSQRVSETLTAKTLYQAVRLSNGNVLRISVTQSNALALLLGMLPSVCAVLAAAILLSAALANRITKRMLAPIDKIDLEHPLDNDAYEELAPLLLRIARQQRQIERQMQELKEKQNEFCAITESMNEGLVLLNERGAIVSINPAARTLFGAGEPAAGEDFLGLERSREVRAAIALAMESGRGQTTLTRDGRQYELDASRIVSGQSAAGTAILTFDVTEKALAEQQRREFTANVSHELKTPLHSIMGSAELLESGLVKPEDTPRFIGHIRTESARLVTLIDDVIRLSQLDEGGALHKEAVDLTALAKETAAQLSAEAEKKQVALTVDGPSVTIPGVKRLLHEILYNLTDNAIKYNRCGGHVRICVSSTNQSAMLRVEDEGIGIPKEYHSRIFERFYRVDQSRSKESGGTGLGLSIVKHAVRLHGGEIHLTSAPEKGTAITIILPK